MTDDDLFANADKLLVAMDFAGMAAAQAEKHRQEMAGLLLDLLSVVDSLQALEAHCRELTTGGGAEAPLRSVSVILHQTLSLLSQAGVEPLNAAGQPLDLSLHEVVEVKLDSSVEEDTILEEVVRGYRWRTRLLRRAKVAISRPGGDGADD